MLLFESIEDQKHYELSVATAGPGFSIEFRQVSNLFHPKTLDESLAHDGHGTVPGIKDDQDNWDLRGHRSRIVEVNEEALALFASLYDEPGTPALEARLPIVHSQEILRVLERFAKAPRKLSDLGDDYFSTVCFDETNAQRDGTIRRDTRQPNDPSELVLSGPHFYVATPFAKTPNEGCRHNQDYSVIDLTSIPDDYLPRTNYVPACSPAEYTRRTHHWRGKPVTDYYRHVNRRMIAPTGERTLIPCIAPPGPAHVDLVFSVALGSVTDLLLLSGACSSIPVDFLAKVSGKGDARIDFLGIVPIPTRLKAQVVARALRLNCVTSSYSAIWGEAWVDALAAERFASNDARLPGWSTLTRQWTFESALRTPFARRQALVELDALVALDLGIDLEALVTAYSVQFPVMQQYERETFYDQRGHIVFTVSKGLAGVGLSRVEWEQVRSAQGGDRLPDFASAFVPPFDRCDREEDLRRAYIYFAPLLGL